MITFTRAEMDKLEIIINGFRQDNPWVFQIIPTIHFELKLKLIELALEIVKERHPYMSQFQYRLWCFLGGEKREVIKYIEEMGRLIHTVERNKK